MDTIFTRGPSLNIRLTLALVLSVTLIFVDHKMDGFKSTRVYLNSLMSPLQYIANLPGLMLSESAQRLTSQEQLLAENQKLNNQLLLMSEKLQQFEVIAKENAQLRELLQAPVRLASKKMVATGSGALNELYLEHVPHSVDIQEGDTLISSGLGKVFPEGYPVATVKQVVRDESRPFARVIATPLANLDRLRHLLLLWGAEGEPELDTDEKASKPADNEEESSDA